LNRVPIKRKGVKQFVVIIDANHFSNSNSYVIRHIKILFQAEQWGYFLKVHFGLFIRCVFIPLQRELSAIDRFGNLVVGTQLCSAKLLLAVFMWCFTFLFRCMAGETASVV